MIKLLKTLDRHLLSILCVSMFLFYSISRIEYAAAGPDAKSYIDMAETLKDGLGMLDRQQNQYIIPSIGMPLEVLVFKIFGIEDFFDSANLSIALVVFAVCVYMLTGSGFVSASFSVIYWYCLPFPFSLFSVETAILATESIFILSAVLGLRTRNKWILSFLGSGLAVFMLVRPILSPLFYLALGLLGSIKIISFFRKRCDPKLNVIDNYLTYILGALVILGSFSVASRIKHGDSRYVSGTYGPIALYYAFNEYIQLDAVYNSHKWSALSEKARAEGLSPTYIKTSWQDRNKEVMNRITDFVIKHPGVAFKGYMYRLKIYSIDSPTIPYNNLVHCWLYSIVALLVGFFKVMSKNKYFLGVFFNFVTIYTVLLQSLFSYVEPRYYSVIIPIMLFSLVANLNLIATTVLNFFHSIKID